MENANPMIDMSLDELIAEKKRAEAGGRAPRPGQCGPGGRGRDDRGRFGGRGFPQDRRGMPGRGGPHAYMQGNPMANPMMNPMMMMGGAMGGMMGGFNNNNQPPPPAGRAPGGMGMGGGPQQQPGQPFLPKEIYRHAKTQQFQSCSRDEAGNVMVRYRDIDLAVVKPNGEVVISSGGQMNASDKAEFIFITLNDALAPIGVKIKLAGEGNRHAESEWFVTDGGKFMKKFVDGMVLPVWMGTKVPSRADAVFNAMTDNEHRQLALLAEAASKKQMQKHTGNDRRQSGGNFKPY